MLEILFSVVAGLLLVPVVVLFLQILLACGPMATSRSRGGRPRAAILVPAHNESLVITDTLAALRPQLVERDRLLVVADNCSDDTAALAKSVGAEVVERRDEERRGKGYALDYGVRHLESNPPAVLVILDADCESQPGAIDALVRCCDETGRPAQALYLMRSPDGAGLKTRIAEFAWLVKNRVRPLGWRRLGLPCQLMGTGMAFPWKLIAGAGLANASIVEDMKLGVDLALAGYPPSFCPEALVTSSFPTGEGAVRSQRTRWEHGHLSMILGEAPKLVWHGLRQRNAGLGAMALDLAVPPLALLSLLLGGLCFLAVVAVWFGASPLVAWLAAMDLLLFVVAVLAAWARWGRDILGLRELLLAPLYVVSKIAMYARFCRKRQKNWVRTERKP